jgi:hypothetical protein
MSPNCTITKFLILCFFFFSCLKFYFSICVHCADYDLTLRVIDISTRYRSPVSINTVSINPVCCERTYVHLFLQRLKAYLIFLAIPYDEV